MMALDDWGAASRRLQSHAVTISCGLAAWCEPCPTLHRVTVMTAMDGIERCLERCQQQQQQFLPEVLICDVDV